MTSRSPHVAWADCPPWPSPTQRNSDLLAIGSRGLGVVAGFIVGSVASETIAETERPVVLVRSADGTGKPPDGGRASGPIVAGLDIRQPCDNLLVFALEEAAHRDTTLIVVHGWTRRRFSATHQRSTRVSRARWLTPSLPPWTRCRARGVTGSPTYM
ncbi:universal stress protein [Streptomyces sp. NBC_00161]|uniref:universal stress protein n=1 Tax=Streptomyces sp. NBC_00161 TaxID=2975671 RepID=UPI003864C0D2